MKDLASYASRYEHVRFERLHGVLTMTLHTRGGPLEWGHGPHEELGHCFADVAEDQANKVVILTGTGGRFIAERPPGVALEHRPWDSIMADAHRLLTRLMEIPVPVVAAVEGHVSAHAELALLSDIVVAAPDFSFRDRSHFVNGAVPGDGVHVVWPMLLGLNRARYHLLTGETLDAELAHRLGVVNEIVPRERLLPRAHEIAARIAEQDSSVLRYTRAVLTDKIRRELSAGLSLGLAHEGMGVLARSEGS
jgi:enoyl-CoA hydratase/carnithine racemase